MPYLTVRIKNSEGHSFTDLDKDRLVLGRSSRTEIAIKHTSISREHCAFVREGEAWFVEDLGSSNGTWVNKEKVKGRQVLAERDIVKAGQARLTFHSGARSAAGAGDEIAVDLDDDDGPKGPTRVASPDDPPEAAPCQHCGAWMSIAHRLAGDTMDCPRCGKRSTVPSMVTA